MILTNSIIVSISAVLSFLILFGLGSYLTSYLKGDISKSLFTISQSLAFANKPIVIIFLTIGLYLVAYLNYSRGPRKYYYLRQFLLLVIYSLVLSLLWVTTYYNQTDHYILASIIFTCIVIYIIMTCILYYISMKTRSIFVSGLLITIPILTGLVFLGLMVSNINEIRTNVSELFPSFENSMLFLFLVTILIQGIL